MFQASINTIHGRRMSKSKKPKPLHIRHLESTQKYHGNLLKTSVLMCQKVDTLYICSWETECWHCLTSIKTIWRVLKGPKPDLLVNCTTTIHHSWLAMSQQLQSRKAMEQVWMHWYVHTNKKSWWCAFLQRIVINASNKKTKKGSTRTLYMKMHYAAYLHEIAILTFYTHLRPEPTLRCE